jgi:putative chitinase
MADPRTPEEFEKWLEEQAELYNDGLITEQQYIDAKKDAKAKMIGYTDQMRTATAQLKKSFLDLGSAIVKGEEGAAVYNKGINSAADAVDTFASKFGFVGKIIGGLVTAGAKYVAAVNNQSDALMKNYQELSRNGLAMGMQDTFKNLQDMGYTAAEIGKMGDLMRENATVFANFGGTAAQGAATFAKASKEIQFSGMGTQFQLMGMTVDDVNKGMAGYMKAQQTSGALGGKTAQEIAVGAQEYILRQDKLTKLTGLSADQQQSIVEQAQNEQRFAATRAELLRKGDAKSLALAARNDDLIKQFTASAGPDTAKQLQAYLSGNMNSEEAQQFRRSFGATADLIDAGVTDIGQIMDTGAAEARSNSAKNSNLAKAGVASKIYGNYAEQVKFGGQGIKQSFSAAEKAADEEQKGQRAGNDKNAAGQVALRQAQRNTTQTADLLVNKGIGPTTSAMAGLAETMESATNVVGKLAGRSGKVGDKGKPGPGSGTPAAGGGGGGVGAPVGAEGLAQKLGSAGIKDKTAQANILAQIQAESGGVAKSENMNYSPEALLKTFPKQVKSIEQARQIVSQGPEAIGNVVYGGRMGNADNEGYKYRGRGLIQLTGKANYAKFSQLVGVDLVKDPELANDPQIAQKIAVAYFQEAEKRGVNLKDINQVGKAVGYQDIGGQETAKRAQIAKNIEASGVKSAATGGILSGPKSGYNAMLHGTEAVIPLPDGKSIPVQMSGAGGSSSQSQIILLTQELEKLESLVKVVQKNNDITNKILQRQA